jgi:hypothetical protein
MIPELFFSGERASATATEDACRRTLVYFGSFEMAYQLSSIPPTLLSACHAAAKVWYVLMLVVQVIADEYLVSTSMSIVDVRSLHKLFGTIELFLA